MDNILTFVNDDEALRIASNLESQVCAFYSFAAKNARNRETKLLFNQLADDENKHSALFDALREELHAEEAQILWGEEDELISTYFRNLVDTHVLSGLEKERAAKKDDLTAEEACRIAIQTEKDAILFYSEAAKLCKNHNGRKMFKEIVEEEKQHLTDLAHHLKDLVKKEAT